MAIQIVITDAGRAELVAAIAGGIAPVELTEVGIGSGQYTPVGDETGLLSETKRLSTISGIAADAQTLHLTIKDESGDGYLVNEFGIFTASGTLFALYSHPADLIIEKSPAAALLLSIDIALSTIDAAALSFGDLTFINPQATTEEPGISEYATNAETATGTAADRTVTPKGLKYVLDPKLNSVDYKAATTAQAGKLRLASSAVTLTGSNSDRAVTPSGLKALTATQTRKGLIARSTDTEAEDMSSSEKALVPSNLAALFPSIPGSFEIPNAGGVPNIIKTGVMPAGTSGTVTFADAFPNALTALLVMPLYNVVAGGLGGGGGAAVVNKQWETLAGFGYSCAAENPSPDTFQQTSMPIQYIAIGN